MLLDHFFGAVLGLSKFGVFLFKDLIACTEAVGLAVQIVLTLVKVFFFFDDSFLEIEYLVALALGI